MQEGVARLVDTAIRQLAQTPGPATNEMPLGGGGQYGFAPITEHNAQQHVAANPAAHQSHLGAPSNAQAANAAQAAYENAQRQYEVAMQQAGIQQQVAGLQSAAVGMDQFAGLAGVRDPMAPQPPSQAAPQIILPPGVEMTDGSDDGPVPVLW